MITLPTLTSLDQNASVRIWLATEPTDMRCGFDRLAERAGAVTGQSPLDGHLFLFRGRSGDRLKILYWDRDGFAIYYKRLEKGTFQFPASPEKSVVISSAQLLRMLSGMELAARS